MATPRKVHPGTGQALRKPASEWSKGAHARVKGPLTEAQTKDAATRARAKHGGGQNKMSKKQREAHKQKIARTQAQYENNMRRRRSLGGGGG